MEAYVSQFVPFQNHFEVIGYEVGIVKSSERVGANVIIISEYMRFLGIYRLCFIKSGKYNTYNSVTKEFCFLFSRL